MSTVEYAFYKKRNASRYRCLCGSMARATNQASQKTKQAKNQASQKLNIMFREMPTRKTYKFPRRFSKSYCKKRLVQRWVLHSAPPVALIKIAIREKQ